MPWFQTRVLRAVRGGQPWSSIISASICTKGSSKRVRCKRTAHACGSDSSRRNAEGLAMFRERCHPRPRVAVETTGATWAFVDALQPTGATVCVVDPRETRLKAGFAAKTDRLDARRLADALRRDSVVSVFLPPPAIRELREVCRGRHQLIRLRTRLVQMILA